MTNNNTHIEHNLNKKFQKQTWTILVAISIPIFLTAISLWLKACKILPVMGVKIVADNFDYVLFPALASMMLKSFLV